MIYVGCSLNFVFKVVVLKETTPSLQDILGEDTAQPRAAWGSSQSSKTSFVTGHSVEAQPEMVTRW